MLISVTGTDVRARIRPRVLVCTRLSVIPQRCSWLHWNRSQFTMLWLGERNWLHHISHGGM